MKFALLALLGLLVAVPVRGDGEGLTPAMAVELAQDEISATVRNSLYFSYTVSKNGIMDISLRPVDGEVDLTVVHFSGSPAVESRREGMNAEEVSLRAIRGDKYLIRVISPFGRAAAFKLKASLEPTRAAGRNEDYFAPERTRDGRTETTAVDVPLGKSVPVEAMGERYFRTRVPAGYVLSAALYPIHGDADLGVGLRPGGTGWSHVSRRRGLLVEHLYMPAESDSDVLIRVNPAPGNDLLYMRYVLTTRLHYSGVDSLKTAPTLEIDPRSTSSDLMDEPLGLGLPGRMERREGASKLLRLP